MLVIHLPKELDHHNCRNLRYETDLLLSENYITRMVFDFSRTVFMDSSGIGILLNRYKQMQRSGGQCGHLWRGSPDQPDTESGWHLEPDQWIFIKRSGDCRNGGVRKMEDKKEEKNENIQGSRRSFCAGNRQ